MMVFGGAASTDVQAMGGGGPSGRGPFGHAGPEPCRWPVDPRPILIGEVDSTKTEDLVVHLVNVPNFWRGRTNTRLLMPGMVGAFVVVAAAIIRTANGEHRGLLGSFAAAVFVVALLFVYVFMRRWNATVFVPGGRVGGPNRL